MLEHGRCVNRRSTADVGVVVTTPVLLSREYAAGRTIGRNGRFKPVPVPAPKLQLPRGRCYRLFDKTENPQPFSAALESITKGGNRANSV